MAKEPIVVVQGGYSGGKTVMDSLGDTEHRRNVLADMQNKGMGEQAQALAEKYNVTLPQKTSPTEGATATPTEGTTTASGYTYVGDGYNYNGENDVKVDVDAIYDPMIAGTDKHYNSQIAAVQEWGKKQADLQQERTDFELEKIEQQKAETEKEYKKEQGAAYVDYQKQINPYGVNAEGMASQGMNGTGYSESSRVSMHNTYQNRVASARQSFEKAVVSYNNAMTEARLQNNSALAELAFQTLQTTLELSLQGFQYKNSLITAKAGMKLQVEEMNYQRYRDTVNDVRYENEMKYKKEQDAIVNAFNFANVGDYSYLEALGIEIDYDLINASKNEAEHNRKWQEALTSAEFGDFSKLEKLGVKISDEYKEAFKEGLKGNSISLDGLLGISSEEVESGLEEESTATGEGIKPTAEAIISTPYYKGPVNKDALNGTFKTTDTNGVMYQPNNINGQPLSWAKDENGVGLTDDVYTMMQYGDKKGEPITVTQKIWKTKDGRLWFWNGIMNEYEEYESGSYSDLKSEKSSADKTSWDYSKYSFK